MLKQIYNAILSTIYFPNKWKHAYKRFMLRITIVQMTGKRKDDLKHYRPIRLLTLFQYFREVIVTKTVSSLNTLSRTHNGFRTSHSCPR